MSEHSVKIFQLNPCDWWAGYDLESVIEEYKLQMDVDDSELKNPHEITDLDMQRLKFVDGDDPINADGTPGGTLSFRDALDQMIALDPNQFPCFFASTEY